MAGDERSLSPPSPPLGIALHSLGEEITGLQGMGMEGTHSSFGQGRVAPRLKHTEISVEQEGFGFFFFCAAVGWQCPVRLCLTPPARQLSCPGCVGTLRKMNPHYLLKGVSETTLNPRAVVLVQISSALNSIQW